MKILLAMDTSPSSKAALDEIAARQWPHRFFLFGPERG